MLIRLTIKPHKGWRLALWIGGFLTIILYSLFFWCKICQKTQQFCKNKINTLSLQSTLLVLEIFHGWNSCLAPLSTYKHNLLRDWILKEMSDSSSLSKTEGQYISSPKHYFLSWVDVVVCVLSGLARLGGWQPCCARWQCRQAWLLVDNHARLL